MPRLIKALQVCLHCSYAFKAKGTKQKFCSLVCSRQGAAVGRRQFGGRSEQEVIDKCKEVWGIGGTDAEAALWAQISPFALCNYLKAHPEVVELRNVLKHRPILLARLTIVAHIGDSFDNAMKYLERKLPEEFVCK